MREPYIGVSLRAGQVVMYLGGVRHGVQVFADGSQRASDQVGGALMAHAKHHGGANVKGVTLPVEVSCAAAWDDVSAHARITSIWIHQGNFPVHQHDILKDACMPGMICQECMHR